MADTHPPKSGIYLIIDFDWPNPFEPEHGKNARKLHNVVQNQDWIREIITASDGVGAGPSSSWIFWLENYAALDRLFRDTGDEVHLAYQGFFADMPIVVEKIRHEVIFL